MPMMQETLDLMSEDCLDAIAALVVVETSPDDDREARYADAYERAICTWEFEHGS